MRICFLIRSLNFGGAERQLVELACGLQQRGHTVTVLSFYDGGPLAGDLDEAGIPRRALGKRGRWDVAPFLIRLARMIRALSPDVIHSYATVPNIAAALVSPFLKGPRLVWGVRASGLPPEAYDATVHASLWLSARLSRCADLIIANSWAGAAHYAALGYPRSRIVVVPNGIDTGRFRPDPVRRTAIRAEWGIAADEILIGNVARLDPMKDHATFLGAAALVRAQRSECRFVCVGAAGEAQRQALLALADRAGLGLTFRWLPATHDPSDVYRALDLHCSSSSYGEGFSNAIGEALATGVPCVATDVGDAALLLDGVGLVVPTGDPGALAVAILTTLDRRSAALAEDCRRRIVDEYDVPKLIARTEAALDALRA